MFEQEFEIFLEDQKRSASGARLELLKKDLVGEKKLIRTALWPVLKSFKGIILEYEVVSITGVKIYIDVFYEPLRLAFESEGFVVHAETITRERFAFERMRIRTMALYGYKYIPFSWDELDKKPEACCRAVYELFGRYSGSTGLLSEELTVYEREIIRYALRLNRPFDMSDVCRCLQLEHKTSRKVLYGLMEKKLISPCGGGKLRHHEYMLEARAVDYLH